MYFLVECKIEKKDNNDLTSKPKKYKKIHLVDADNESKAQEKVHDHYRYKSFGTSYFVDILSTDRTIT